MERRRSLEHNRYGVYSMLFNWIISIMALVVALWLPMLMSKDIYPTFILGMAVLLYYYVRNNRFSTGPSCCVLPFVMSRSLLISALVMYFINFLHSENYIYLIFTDVYLVNPDIPYISSLIIFPITCVMSARVLIRKYKMPYCIDCERSFGTRAERGFLGEFYSHEGLYQSRSMMGLTGVMSVAGYLYYFLFYVNCTFSRADFYVFVVAPTILLVCSILFVSIRYVGTWNYYSQNFGADNSKMGRTTKIRFLIINGDDLLIKIPELDTDDHLDDTRIDTPVTLTLRRRLDVTTEAAADHFRNITAIDDFEIRLLYSNTTESSEFSLFHFLVVLPSKKLPEGARLSGEWLNLHEIGQLLNAQQLSPLLSAEVIRLYTIALTSKTYDINGNRRYTIKRYRPAVRISDLANPDIDYNDVRWLYIHDHNADKPFFKLRRLWSRNISGAFKHDNKIAK